MSIISRNNANNINNINAERFQVLLKMKMKKNDTSANHISDSVVNKFKKYLMDTLNIDGIFGDMAGSIINIQDKEIYIDVPYITFTFDIIVDIDELSENEGTPREQLKSWIEIWGDKSIWQERLELTEISLNNKNKNKNNIRNYDNYILELNNFKVKHINMNGGKRIRRMTKIKKYKSYKRTRKVGLRF